MIHWRSHYLFGFASTFPSRPEWSVGVEPRTHRPVGLIALGTACLVALGDSSLPFLAVCCGPAIVWLAAWWKTTTAKDEDEMKSSTNSVAATTVLIVLREALTALAIMFN